MVARMCRLARRCPSTPAAIGAEHVEQTDQRQRVCRHFRRHALVLEIARHVHADEDHLEAADEVAGHQQLEAAVGEGLAQRLPDALVRATVTAVRGLAHAEGQRNDRQRHAAEDEQARSASRPRRSASSPPAPSGTGRTSRRPPSCPWPRSASRARRCARSRRRPRHRWCPPGPCRASRPALPVKARPEVARPISTSPPA